MSTTNKLIACCEEMICINHCDYVIYSYEDDKVLELIKSVRENDECPHEISDMLTFVRNCTYDEYKSFEHKFDCLIY